MGTTHRRRGAWKSGLDGRGPSGGPGILLAGIVLVLAAACAQESQPAPTVNAGPETQGPAAAAAPKTSAAPRAATTSTGENPHDLYAAKGFTCESCHPCGVRQAGGHGIAWMDKASAGFHAYSANSNLAGCRSCHGTNLDGVGGSTTVSCAQCHGASWKTSCVLCHGGTDNQTGAPPKTIWGYASDAVRVGTHTAHVSATHGLSRTLDCGVCHVKPADALSAGHADGTTANVVFSGLASQGAGTPPAWDRATATCSNTYCHGATLGGGGQKTPVWTLADGTQRACTSCHGAPPPPPHSTSTNCGSCHTGYTSTTVNPATHVNGLLEVTSPHAAGWADKTQHGYQVNLTGLTNCKTCHGASLTSCTTCHSTAGFAAWDTNCTFCHGNRATGRPSPPLDIQGRSVATNVSVGRHDKHVAPALMNPIACTECHPARTASVITDVAHVDGNGIAEVAFGPLSRTGGKNPTYTRASAVSATCSGTYCHGNFTGGNTSAIPNWTSATAMTCTSCHGNPPSSGEHSKHQGEGVGCFQCHGTGYTRTGTTTGTVNAGLHLNGLKNVGGAGTKIRTWARPSCTPSDTSACHGNENW